MYVKAGKGDGMVRRIALFVVVFCLFAGTVSFSEKIKAEKPEKPGLVGAWFGESDLTNCKDADLLKTLEQTWDESDDYGKEWSGKWQGFLVAPASGEITFYAETDSTAILEIDGKKIIQLREGQAGQSGTISMVKGRNYPIEVTYLHDGGFDGYLRVKWSWAGQDEVSIPADNLRHTEQQERYWHWQSEEVSDFVRSFFVTVPVKNVFVYKEPGRFCGWPANNGIWIWDDEILVGFELAYYKFSKYGHSRDNDRPVLNVLARSVDGGESWELEDPENFVGDGLKAVPCPGDIDFAHADFTMRCGRDDEFFTSYDRGKNWQGSYQLPDFVGKDLSARTDYIVNGPLDCLFFLSAEEEKVEAGLQDRAFCVRTTDGGKTFRFLGWMTHNIRVRSVMPATVRISDTELISAMRRRHDVHRSGLPDIMKNWIDVYCSNDNGKTWKFLSKVADTDRGKRNGNPPSMVRLKDGRLCVTYGYRSAPYGIRAKLSSDNGKTWGPEIHLRDDGLTWDLGYTRTVQRPDGKLVTVYYYTTEENPEQHIAATIWDPDIVSKKGSKK